MYKLAILQRFTKTNASLKELDDKLLADHYRSSGNQQALAELFNRYKGLLLGVCYKYLQDTEAAADALSDIYVELVDKMQRHVVDTPKAWLHTLARNHCLMKLRKEKNTATQEIQDYHVQSEGGWHPVDNAAVEKENKLQALEHCIEQLKKDQQLAVRLFYLEQKCYNEIADATGIAWNTIRSHIQNGRRNLKICMEQHEQAAR